MRTLQYRWLFVFLWCFCGVWCWYVPSFLAIVCWGWVTMRILFLRQKIVCYVLVGCTLLFGASIAWQTYTMQQAQSIVYREGDYQLQINPLTLRETDYFLSGEGELWHHGEPTGIRVMWRYASQEAVELPQQVEHWNITGKLKPPEHARNFSVFDYANYLKTRGIYWQLDIERINARSFAMDWQARLENLRLAMLNPFMAQSESEWVNLHNKLLWNLDSSVYREWRTELATLGVVHFFAISGFHIHYIRKMLHYFVRRVGIPIEIAEMIVAGLLCLYSWLVQFPVGVVRVLLMIYGGHLVRRYQLPFSRVDQLSLIGLLLLWLQPTLCQSLSYALSFLMTYCIHFFANAQQLPRPKWREQLELTLTCLLFSWPIMMQTAHEWNGWQIVSIIVITILFERVLFPLSVLTSVLLAMPFLDTRFLWQNVSAVLENVKTIKFDFLSYTVGQLPEMAVLALVALASYWLYAIHRTPKCAYMSIILGYAFVLGGLPYLNPTTRVTIIDVGQGDSLLYQPAFSKNYWLIDTGGKAAMEQAEGIEADETYAQRNLIPALKALGVNRLSGVIITHPDMDHMGNLLALSKEIPINQLIVTPYTIQSDLWQKIAPFLAETTDIRVMPFQTVWQNDGLAMTFYTIPDVSQQADMDGSNDTSIATILPLGDKMLLNLGDLSAKADELLLQHYPQLQADMVKLGHHGSKHSTSDQLLAQLSPKIALISAGVNNRYGHPHDELIAKLNEWHIPYLATNEKGAIQLSYNVLTGYQWRTALD